MLRLKRAGYIVLVSAAILGTSYGDVFVLISAFFIFSFPGYLASSIRSAVPRYRI